MTESAPTRHLMIIDDDQVDQYLYKRMIKRSGVFTSTIMFSLATDALEHLRKTEREKIDLIVLDINMPRMDGFEFLEVATTEFGENLDSSIVLLMTASLAPRDVERAKSFSVVAGILNKPLTVEILKSWPDTLFAQ